MSLVSRCCLCFVFNSPNYLFIVVCVEQCDRFVYLCHVFIRAMRLFRSQCDIYVDSCPVLTVIYVCL